MKLIPYIKTASWGVLDYKPLKPTGRWKLKSGPYYTNQLFIEHDQGLCMRAWISEYSIVFQPEATEVIFECKSNG